MSITGVCDSIALADSNFGVVSWNNQCNSIAQVKDCVMTVKVKDDNSDDDANAVVYMIGEDGERVDVTSGSIRVEGEDGEKVDISPAGVHVNSEDGEKVDISPAGIYVDDEGTSVQITPTGMVVKENGEEVVNIGMDGIKVK